VWRIGLKGTREFVAAMRSLLSADESARADRFYFPEHRDRFTVGRGVMRSILAAYIGMPADEIQFAYNQFGKPSLITPGSSDLRFNVSHSGDLALLAVTRACELGVDVEALRDVFDADRIAARFFDAPENETYQTLPADCRTEGFFVRWTLKEAYIKARGKGLSIPLHSFTICSIPDRQGRHTIRSEDPADDAHWFAMRLPSLPGFIAALVVQRHDSNLACLEWRPDEPTSPG
jgi:4'-phosphopantetheinyl transferase